MRLYAALAYAFLYLPIAVIVAFSFTAGRSASELRGFSLQWYGKALSNPFVTEALRTSLVIALLSASLATLAGTAAALGLERLRGPWRTVLDALIYVAIMVPGIVIGIATLIALVTVFDALNPVLAAAWPALLGSPPRLGLGLGSVVAAHGLFGMALCVVVVRARLASLDPALLEASADLYADPWTTFRRITLPQLAPAILAAFLLAFTFSFDDFIVAFFVAGPNTTLPIYVFSSIRRGVTPEINAIGTMVLLVSLLLTLLIQRLLRPAAAR